MHQGFLAPTRIDGAAHRALDGRRHRIEISPARARQGVECLEHRVVDHVAHVDVILAQLGQPGENNVGIANEIALLADRDSDGHDAREG